MAKEKVCRNNSKDYLHKEYPKTRAADDFWGQVCRTVKGKSVSQGQIDSIINAISFEMKFDRDDCLLDLGCGNGALASYFYKKCEFYLGVDFSEYLIEVANKHFACPPQYTFLNREGVDYVLNERNPERYNKALCYGAFMYFSYSAAEQVLQTLASRFLNLEKIFLGNMPDSNRAKNFYLDTPDYTKLLDGVNSPLGIWRSESEMSELARKTGWIANFSYMPKNFYSSHYRYDAILTRQVEG